jgi:excisionase family DNA binding protein
MNLISVAAFARQHGLKHRTVVRAIQAGQLPALKIGKRWRLDTAAIRDLARQRRELVTTNTPVMPDTR